MKYSFLFISLGSVLAALNFSAGFNPVTAWFAVAFIFVGIGYSTPGNVAVFGKNAAGRISPVSFTLMFPYLLTLLAVWNLLRLFRKEEPFHELIPGVFIGRRLKGREMPEKMDAVLDLTCEFFEPESIVRSKKYISFPIMDGFIPDEKKLLELIYSLEGVRGNLYIHCAEGHGRTGLIAMCILLSRGLAADPAEALAAIRKVRKGVGLSVVQRKFMEKIQDKFKREKPEKRVAS